MFRKFDEKTFFKVYFRRTTVIICYKVDGPSFISKETENYPATSTAPVYLK